MPSHRCVPVMPTAWTQGPSSESGSCPMKVNTPDLNFHLPFCHSAAPSPLEVLVTHSYFNKKTSSSPRGPKRNVLTHTDKSINVPYRCWHCWQVPLHKHYYSFTIIPPTPSFETHIWICVFFP